MHSTPRLTLAILSCVCVSASSLNAADALVSPLSARSDLALAETPEARADDALLELKSQGGKSASSDTLAAAHERILLARAATRTMSAARSVPLSTREGVIQMEPSGSRMERFPPEVVVMW